MRYRLYEWDSLCIQAEEFLNGLRKDFRDNGYSDKDLPSYTSKVIMEYIDDMHILVSRKRFAAILGAMLAFKMTDKPIVKKYAYDVVMNMWEYMDVVYLIVYMELSDNNERMEFLRKKRWQFFQWYSLYSNYDVSRYHHVMRQVLDITQYILFEPEKYTFPVILMAYIYMDVCKPD